MTDFQPYLLPSADSWAIQKDEADILLNFLIEKGITHIFCIPPIKMENPENNGIAIQNIFQDFRKRNSGKMEFRLSARYRLDNGFMQLLTANNLLTIGEKLIIDVSPLNEHPETWDMLKAINGAGYKPIIFQPERTTYWKEEDFRKLKAMNCDLVLNLYSFFGYNGDNALLHSRELLAADMYTYLYSGIEDTKVMRYSENFSVQDDKDILNAVLKLQENGRQLWSDTLSR